MASVRQVGVRIATAWLYALLPRALAVLFRIDRTPAPHTFEHLLSGSCRPAGGLRVGYACYGLEPCDLSDAELRAHVLLLGRPGDNASQLVASLALQQVARGGGCIVVGTPPATYMGPTDFMRCGPISRRCCKSAAGCT